MQSAAPWKPHETNRSPLPIPYYPSEKDEKPQAATDSDPQATSSFQAASSFLESLLLGCDSPVSEAAIKELQEEHMKKRIEVQKDRVRKAAELLEIYVQGLRAVRERERAYIQAIDETKEVIRKVLQGKVQDMPIMEFCLKELPNLKGQRRSL